MIPKVGLGVLGFWELEYAITKEGYRIIPGETKMARWSENLSSNLVGLVVEKVLKEFEGSDNDLFAWVKNEEGRCLLMGIDHFESINKADSIQRYKKKEPTVRLYICRCESVMKPVGNIGNALDGSGNEIQFYECPKCKNLVGV